MDSTRAAPACVTAYTGFMEPSTYFCARPACGNGKTAELMAIFPRVFWHAYCNNHVAFNIGAFIMSAMGLIRIRKHGQAVRNRLRASLREFGGKGT